MTTILDFVKISKVAGVKHYSLVSKKGKRLAGNHQRSESFYKELAQFGKDATAPTTRRDLSPLTAMIIQGESGALIVVPVGSFILEVTPATGYQESSVVDEVLRFLDRIRHQHTVSQKS
ncbi:MAG: roadblock/LC7 domain-containing protein [Desulfobacterales bacterium]|nr:roadblock/LC7 domain-containing protein [Desulfobacterales bacterium]